MAQAEGAGYFEDGWLQIFALLAVASGVFSGHLLATSLRAAKAEAARALAPSAAPASAPAAEAAASRGLEPKQAGRWVVDARMGEGADCPTLWVALLNARDGDTIVVRPGVYKEQLSVAKSVTLRGEGAGAEEVHITHPGERTLQVTGPAVTLENLTLSNSGPQEAWTLEASKSRLTLRDVRIRSSARGLRASDADLELSGGEIDARVALALEGRSSLRLSGTSLTGVQGALSVSGDGFSADLKGARLASWHRTVSAKGAGTLTLTDCTVAQSGAEGALLVEQAELRLERTTVSGSRGVGLTASRFAVVRARDSSFTDGAAAGVVVRGAAEVRLERGVIRGNRDCALQVDGAVATLSGVKVAGNRCGVGFLSPGTLDVRDSHFSDNALGALAVRQGIEKDVVLRGGGNTGLTLPARAAN